MIILGDQFPLNGGLLRNMVLKKAMAKGEIDKEDIRYDIHDVDAPWRQRDGSKVKVLNKWSDYWSLGARNPLTLSIPEINIQNMNSCLGLIKGLSYLVGPITNKTIASEDKSNLVLDKVKSIITENVNWLAKLAHLMEKNRFEINEKKEAVLRLIIESRSIKDLFSRISYECMGYQVLNSTWQIYKEDSIKDIYLPREHYWSFSNIGHRTNFDSGMSLNGNILIPKGLALFVDFASRGFSVGFTGCGYLDDTKRIRDRYLKGQSIKLVKISFDWVLETDIFSCLIQSFKEKKAIRGKGIPDINMNDIAKIRNYWNSRPTELAYWFLGGTLNATIEKITI